MQTFNDPSTRGYARATGAFYLGIAVFGAYAIGFVPSQIIVSGDAAATLANLVGKRGLLLSGIGADALVMLLEIMATTLLYFMFKPVNGPLAFAAALARLSMVAVMSAMLFFHAGALALAEPSGALAEFAIAERAALAGLLLDMHHAGVWIWQLFFFLHLLLLGQLVARSGRFPVWLGRALSVGGVGYLLDSLHAFAFPDAGWLGMVRIGFLVLVTLAEVGFALWLLIRAPEGARA